MIKEFKEFILRGNVIDLAVGVVIGSAFTAIVTSLVEGLLTPLVSELIILNCICIGLLARYASIKLMRLSLPSLPLTAFSGNLTLSSVPFGAIQEDHPCPIFPCPPPN